MKDPVAAYSTTRLRSYSTDVSVGQYRLYILDDVDALHVKTHQLGDYTDIA
jgi:hypothetical protein